MDIEKWFKFIRVFPIGWGIRNHNTIRFFFET